MIDLFFLLLLLQESQWQIESEDQSIVSVLHCSGANQTPDRASSVQMLQLKILVHRLIEIHIKYYKLNNEISHRDDAEAIIIVQDL